MQRIHVSGIPLSISSHLLCAAIVCTLLGSLGCGSSKQTITQIRDLVQIEDLDRAVTLGKSIQKGDPNWIEAQYILGRIEASRNEMDAALHYYDSVPEDGSQYSLRCAAAAGEIEYQRCQPAASLKRDEYQLRKSRTDLVLHKKLAALYTMTGQRFKASPHLMELVKGGHFDLKELVWLSAPERIPDQDDYLARCEKENSTDVLVQLGIAVKEINRKDLSAAKKRVEKIIQEEPQLAEAQAIFGELCLDEGADKLAVWNANLPNDLTGHPGVWYVRGMWARQVNQPKVAVRCFWEAISLDPTHQRAMYQLGQVLAPIDAAASKAFSERAQQLKEYGDLMEAVMIHQGRDHEKFQQMVKVLIRTGRDWEVWAWSVKAIEMVGEAGWAGDMQRAFSHVRSRKPPRTRVDRDLSRQHTFADWPGVEALTAAVSPGSTTGLQDADQPPLRFEDAASSAGLSFTYYQSHSADTRGVRMFESTGGGTAVVDFDLNGWPDLFFTQGVEWPFGSERPAPTGQYRDRLFRNNGSRFEDVTEWSCPIEQGYGQGCSAGDFDNDGFPDLYVANIGRNQLLRNNGDGTFTDVSAAASLQGDAWTTSCLMADLNGDGIPDLYDVNYLQGDRIFSIECGANRCSVRGYAGAPDQVQLGRGDGTFELVPDATPKLNSKGLGIVLFRIDRNSLPRLFIANDQVPNFFLRPTGDGRYVDEGLTSGLALNMYGQPTACMGVASGDVNHDGMLDLFVTNFDNEANNLYVQQAPGFFEDAIFASGLMAAGIPYVGWGTQFLDADNNGELDLIVTNGHIADFHEPGQEYRMPLQVFRGNGQTRFAQSPPSEAGPLFERNLFGRSLATCDWNRDGRPDFVVSCLDAPAILATNGSPSSQHWLNLRLHARTSARDAIGAFVELHVGSETRTVQLTAGDGFQATNERSLCVGLGRADVVDRVVVYWPAGGKSEYGPIEVDAAIDLVEGATTVARQTLGGTN